MRHSPIFVFAVAAAMAAPVFAAGATDPLLDGAQNGPCRALVAGPDYAPGVDAQGYPVVPADVGGAAPKTFIPDQVIVPLPGGGERQRGHRDGHGHHRGWAGNGNNKIGPYAVIDGRRLEGLINPPGCGGPAVSPPSRERR